MNKIKEYFGEPIYTYTSKQAEEDGILFDITKINPDWKKGIFNYVTNTLLENGYLKDDKINIPNILDLLNQCIQIVKQKSENFTVEDTFYSGQVEFPDGVKREVFIALNETGKFTIMMPEDY